MGNVFYILEYKSALSKFAFFKLLFVLYYLNVSEKTVLCPTSSNINLQLEPNCTSYTETPVTLNKITFTYLK